MQRTGDIGLFKIVMEGGVAAGIRRVEAITGDNAVRFVQELDARINAAAAVLKAQPSELTQRIVQVQDHVKALEKELGALKSKLASSQGDELVSQAIEIGGVHVLAAQLAGADRQDAARNRRQAEGQAEERGHRAGIRSKAARSA